MAKVKHTYICQNCGANSPKWLGRCPSCGEWNTYVEEIVTKPSGRQLPPEVESKTQPKALPLHEVRSEDQVRMPIPNEEFNRVLGGGIVPGAVVLLGGEPGIGKSTLLLQLATEFDGRKVLYVSGEESAQQIKLRAERLGKIHENCFLLTETNTQRIFGEVKRIEPEMIIIDSIQTLHTATIESSPGSISQIRESAAELIKYAKTAHVPIFLIGHITKDGHLAGPKVLEHMVDTVLQFEGDRNHLYRLLRSIKNRFGSTNELGIFEMHTHGLREVKNPSEILISNRDKSLSGVGIGATMEGLRPMLIEVQALVGSAAYGTPQRSTTGFDLRRLNMLLAVLEKRCGFRLGIKDVFLNITGGLKIDDPALDLAVVSAILSSSEDFPIDPNYCFSAEVGLSGEIKPVTKIDQRLAEAQKLGFEKAFVSSYNMKEQDLKDFDIEIIRVTKIEEVFTELFG